MKTKTKNKSKQIIALVLILMFILPVFNFGIINVSALTNYLTVNYKAGQTFEQAYGTNDREVRILTIVGDGELTYEDCLFIKENLPVVASINFTEAKFKNNKVPDDAFKDFMTLVSFALPPSVTEVGKNAFYNCIMLKNIGITGNLKVINENAFCNCIQLETIALPAGVTKIGDNAFKNCDSLVTVLAMSKNGSSYNAASNAFTGITSKCVLVTPVKAAGYDIEPFAKIKRVEWNFYKLPINVIVAAGIEYTIPVDVTGADGTKAAYQWYRDGAEIWNVGGGDTLVIKNISQDYSGRYTVAITINGTRALFSCIVDVAGTTTGKTEISSKNTAPEHLPEPEWTKYDSMYVTDSKGKVIEECVIYLKEFYNANKLDSLTYIAYTQKIKQIYDNDKTGIFKFYFTGLASGGGLEVPFAVINSIKNIDLTKDNQLRITINGSGQYNIYIAVTDENGKVLYDFKDAKNLPGVYMYLPFDNKTEYMIRIDEAMFAYPVPSVKANSNSMLKFKVQNGFLYSRQTPAAANFTDIKNHWGEKDIINSAKNLIVNGYPDGSYKPNGLLTRAEFATMLTRVLYHNLVWDSAKIKKYGDVKSSDWFSEAVGFADIMGLNGFVTGSDFKPNQQITREEMAYMIEKALVYAGIDTSKLTAAALNYNDLNDIDAKFRDSVKICTNAKLLQGAAGGKFLPKNTLTRAEAATVLNRLWELLAGDI
jgi:hypothetical protein